MDAILNVFAGGLFDVLSVFLPLSLLLDSHTIISHTALILLANGILLAGVLLIYYKAIEPLHSTPISEHLNYILFHTVCVLPVCVYCQLSAPSRYQTLADAVIVHTKRKEEQLRRFVAEGVYGFLIWLTVFLQVQLLSNLLPAILRFVYPYQILSPIVSALCVLSESYGDLMSCALYAWYCFDFRWIAAGLSPDARFAIMEKHWPYFLGFGLPFVVLNKSVSFFVGYGVFMVYFPLAVMIASSVNYEYYSNVQSKAIPSLRLFKPPQDVAYFVLKYIERKKEEKVKAKEEEKEEKNAAAKADISKKED